MSIKRRIKALEKRHKSGNEKITVKLITDDPDDPNFIIIDPYGKEPKRMSKADLDAEHKKAEEAGEAIIIVSYEHQDHAGDL